MILAIGRKAIRTGYHRRQPSSEIQPSERGFRQRIVAPSVGARRDARNDASSFNTLRRTVEVRQRSHRADNTGSRLITEVKWRRALSVLGWETAWEHQMLLTFINIFFLFEQYSTDCIFLMNQGVTNVYFT